MPDKADDARNEFESSFRTFFGQGPRDALFDQPADFWLARLDDGRYEIARIEDAWTGWKAARAASRREVERLSAEAEMLGAGYLEKSAALTRLEAENERLREALRKHAIKVVAATNGRSNGTATWCFQCETGSWGEVDGEKHAPGCLATLSAQGQQEPTGKTSGG